MTFGSLGYGPRAQSVLHCHGVLALRHGPWTPAWTEAVQNESRLQEDSSWDRSCAERKPAPGGHEQGGSWQCRNAGKVKVWSSFLVGSERNVWHSGLRAAGPVRPSLPWCFSPARRSLDSSWDRSCAERKPAPGGHEQGGSWQCRNAGKVKVWS